MDKLQELIGLCRGSVTLTANEQRDVYFTSEDWVGDNVEDGKYEGTVVEPEVLQKMIELDTVFTLTVYPETPIGHFELCHYDLGIMIDIAIEEIKRSRSRI